MRPGDPPCVPIRPAGSTCRSRRARSRPRRGGRSRVRSGSGEPDSRRPARRAAPRAWHRAAIAQARRPQTPSLRIPRSPVRASRRSATQFSRSSNSSSTSCVLRDDNPPAPPDDGDAPGDARRTYGASPTDDRRRSCLTLTALPAGEAISVRPTASRRGWAPCRSSTVPPPGRQSRTSTISSTSCTP